MFIGWLCATRRERVRLEEFACKSGSFFTNRFLIIPVTLTILALLMATSCNAADGIPPSTEGFVDPKDLGILLGAWGTSVVDLDGDQVVSGSDLGLLIGEGGADCS